MKIVVAPDKFAGTLTASEAAEAIAEGWSRTNPAAELVQMPMSDGGPGFIDVLAHVLTGEQFAVTVTGPDREPVPAMLFKSGDTVYLESAQACGIALLENPNPWKTTTYGVGELIEKALDLKPKKIVVGLGGSGTNDGGAGMLAALGATSDKPLDQGPACLEDVGRVDFSKAKELLKNCELVIASDVRTVLLGMFGATRTFGVQKGLDDQDIIKVDHILDQFVVATLGNTPAERRLADEAGAGAAGGLGFALLVLGGQMISGIDLVADVIGLKAAVRDADLVISGEGSFDFSSRDGKVVYGVAQIAAELAKPCIVLAGEVDVGSREMRALGVESGYGLVDYFDLDFALTNANTALADMAQRVARSWTW